MSARVRCPCGRPYCPEKHDRCSCGGVKARTSRRCRSCVSISLPLPTQFPYSPEGGRLLAARFWAHVEIRAEDECWPWAWGFRAKDYGVFDGTTAPRIAVQLATGRLLEREEFVLHSCDNPACCNPAHLEVGTQSRNMLDMWARGRGRRPAIENPRGADGRYTRKETAHAR